MDTLPVDVFQEILDHLVRPITSNTEWPIANSELRALCPLLATCRLWRDVILGMPSMWSCVQVNGPIDDRHVEYVRVRLERSKDVPLDVCLRGVREPEIESDDEEHVDKEQAAHLLNCFMLLSAHRERIRRLYLWAFSIGLDDLVVFNRPWPLLEELILIPSNGHHEYLVHKTWEGTHLRYFKNMSQLRRLDSHIACMVPTQEMLNLSYLSISVRGARVYDSLWETLALTPALEELRIYFPAYRWRESDPGESQSPSLSLPHLERLAAYGYTRFFDWSEQLHAPNLTTLTVSIEYCDVIPRLYRALRDRVRHLIVTSVDPQSAGYLDDTDTIALDEFESLSTFELCDIREAMLQADRQGFFQHLVDRVESTDGSAWPARVPVLILRRCRFSWRACESLLRFIGARHSASAEHGRPILRLELIDTTFIKYGSYKPPGFDDIAHYFRTAQFQRAYVDPWHEPADEWGDWSDADDDGGVIGWHIFDGLASPGSVDDA